MTKNDDEQTILLFINNRYFNTLLILLKLDGWMTSKFGIYKRIRINKNLSAQEMAGFSNVPIINDAINKTHQQLIDIVNTHLEKGDAILDIGCGAGAYLQNFYQDYNCTGIDVNTDMIERGKSDYPSIDFINANFLNYSLNKNSNLFVVSVY